MVPYTSAPSVGSNVVDHDDVARLPHGDDLLLAVIPTHHLTGDAVSSVGHVGEGGPLVGRKLEAPGLLQVLIVTSSASWKNVH